MAPPVRPTRQRDEAGAVSLVELLIALLVLGVISAMVATTVIGTQAATISSMRISQGAESLTINAVALRRDLSATVEPASEAAACAPLSEDFSVPSGVPSGGEAVVFCSFGETSANAEPQPFLLNICAGGPRITLRMLPGLSDATQLPDWSQLVSWPHSQILVQQADVECGGSEGSTLMVCPASADPPSDCVTPPGANGDTTLDLDIAAGATTRPDTPGGAGPTRIEAIIRPPDIEGSS